MDDMLHERDEEIKADFVSYLMAHPEERFWQALRNWSDHAYILVAEEVDLVTMQVIDPQDTFYWENRK